MEGARPGNQVISLTPPFNFSMEILDHPPPEVVHSKEPVFGHLWFCSDRNGNGRLDQVVHLEVAARMRVVDSLRDLWGAPTLKIVFLQRYLRILGFSNRP